MAENKKPEGKPIADVAKPGKSAPSGTSKPVLISNRPILKDPMVITNNADDAETGTAAAETSPSIMATAPTLAPVKTVADAEASAAPDKTTDDKPDEKTIGEEATAPEPVADDHKPAAEKPAAKPDSDEEATEKTNDDDPTAQKPGAEEAEAAKQAEHDAAIQKLVDGKQYFLPINSVEKRKTKRFIILGLVLSLILAAAWADIALDAGLIHISGVKPVTHFFSN